MVRTSPTRRRSLGIVLGLTVATLTLDCQPSEPWTSDNPEFALGAFLSALTMGDDETVRAFLSDDTLAFLNGNLERAHELLGAEADLPEQPIASLYRVWSPSAVEIDRLETLERSDTTATVLIHSVYGEQIQVVLVRDRDRWIIPIHPPLDAPHGPNGPLGEPNSGPLIGPSPTPTPSGSSLR